MKKSVINLTQSWTAEWMIWSVLLGKSGVMQREQFLIPLLADL